MSTVPLARKVMDTLYPLDGTGFPSANIANMAKECLTMCDDGEGCLELMGRVAEDISGCLHGIHDAIRGGGASTLLLEYHKFGSSAAMFLCISEEARVRVARMLYASWQEQESLRTLADCIKQVDEGSLLTAAGGSDGEWRQVHDCMRAVLRRVNDAISMLRDTILILAPVEKRNFECLCTEYDRRIESKKGALKSRFAALWNNSKLCMDDNMAGLALRDMILDTKPQGNILTEKDKYGDIPAEKMVVFIINNRHRLTSRAVDEYLTYRAKWQLLIEHIAFLGIIIIIRPSNSGGSEELKSPLAAYILDEKILLRVIFACRTCTSTKMVYDRVIRLLMQTAIYDKEMMTRKTFLATLIPYLNIHPKPTPNALYQAIYKQM